MIQSKWKRNQFKLNANINTNYCVSSATDHFKNQTREGAAVMRALLERAYAIHMFALFHLVPRIKWEWNLWKLNFCMNGWRNSEIKNETFSIVCRRTPQDFKFGHFTLLFHKERQSNVSKWKIHVRGEVISRCYFMKWKRCTSVACIACIACENHSFCSLNMQITVYPSCENAIYAESVTPSWSSTSSSRKLHCS